MTRRSRFKPYKIRISGLRHPHHVPASVWHRFVARGWLIVTGARAAEARAGVTIWIENSRVRFYDSEAGVGISIPCSWAWIERAALYAQRGPQLNSPEYERAIQRYHCEC